jgi:hypothetical protein
VRPLEGCDDLYFVATGDGSHIFSKTHDEHMKAKQYAKTLRAKLAAAKALQDTVTHEERTKEPAAAAVKETGAGG